MSDGDIVNYDDVLSSILIEEKSLLGFLTTIFNFLARRTDFYYVPSKSCEDMGFPAGMAEELVVKVLRSCDPYKKSNKNVSRSDVNNEIMCSTVAQEVEVVADDSDDTSQGETPSAITSSQSSYKDTSSTDECSRCIEGNSSEIEPAETTKLLKPLYYKPPIIAAQAACETYNGAARDNYCWSQTITDLDLTIKLPNVVKSSKDIKVIINAHEISVQKSNGKEIIIKDAFPHKIKAKDSFWTISEKQLLVHLEKAQERWWDKLFSQEDPIDLTKIDASRPMDELPEDHIAKIRELQWNQERKRRGLPTSEEMRNIEILKKAWNAEGSPFRGTKFDPNILHK